MSGTVDSFSLNFYSFELSKQWETDQQQDFYGDLCVPVPGNAFTKIFTIDRVFHFHLYIIELFTLCTIIDETIHDNIILYEFYFLWTIHLILDNNDNNINLFDSKSARICEHYGSHNLTFKAFKFHFIFFCQFYFEYFPLFIHFILINLHVCGMYMDLGFGCCSFFSSVFLYYYHSWLVAKTFSFILIVFYELLLILYILLLELQMIIVCVEFASVCFPFTWVPYSD